MLTGGMGTFALPIDFLKKKKKIEKKEENISNINTKIIILNNYSSILNTIGLSVKTVLNGLNISL